MDKDKTHEIIREQMLEEVEEGNFFLKEIGHPQDFLGGRAMPPKPPPPCRCSQLPVIFPFCFVNECL